jgi:hypothetical protein
MDDSTRRMTDMDDDDTARATAGIRAEIEETRADLAETVEAIEEKLRPSAAVARVAESVKETAVSHVQALKHAAGEGAGGLMGMMRDNPVPAALIAVGAGWLLANARRGRQRDDRDMHVNEYWREMHTHRQPAMDMSSVRRTGQQAQAHVRRMASENPLLVGAGALLIGAAFGMALPETERENSLMGEARDSLVDRAQQMASDAASRIEEQAGGVADAARDMAESLAPRSQG